VLTARFDRGVIIVPEHHFRDVEDWREFPWFDLDAMGCPLTPALMASPGWSRRSRTSICAMSGGRLTPAFVDRAPRVERIVNVGWPGEEVGAQQLINNEFDVTLDLRPATIEAILAQSDTVITFTGAEKPYGYYDWWPTSLFFNTQEAPFDNPDVRWAVAYAIDQQTMMDVGYGGAGVATAWPFPDYAGLRRYVQGASPELKELTANVLSRDVSKVDELMTGAGYTKNAAGFWSDNGQVLDMEMLIVEIYGDIGPVAVELMRQAGFSVEQINPPDAWDQMGDGRAKMFYPWSRRQRDGSVHHVELLHLRERPPDRRECRQRQLASVG
jgi:peptide/nickel transport system substrate-binding protein